MLDHHLQEPQTEPPSQIYFDSVFVVLFVLGYERQKNHNNEYQRCLRLWYELLSRNNNFYRSEHPLVTTAQTDNTGRTHVDLRASIFVYGIKLIHKFTHAIGLVFIRFIDKKPPFFSHVNCEYDGVSRPRGAVIFQADAPPIDRRHH